MRDVVSLAVGVIVGATLATVVYMTNNNSEQRNQANTVPIEQCLAAILSIKPSGEKQ